MYLLHLNWNMNLKTCIFKRNQWNIVDLQCCISFRNTEKQFHLYIYIYPLFKKIFFSHKVHYRVLNKVSLCYTAGSFQLSILYTVQCIYVNPNLPVHGGMNWVLLRQRTFLDVPISFLALPFPLHLCLQATLFTWPLLLWPTVVASQLALPTLVGRRNGTFC